MGKKKSSSKTTVSPPKWVQPIVEGAAGQISGVVDRNQSGLEGLAGDLRGMLPGLRSSIAGDQGHLAAGFGYANDVLGGKYLNANPYMDDIVHQGEQDAGNAVNSAFSLRGRTGGGANQQALARGVAQAGNQVRFANYNAERDRMTQASGLLPALTASQYAGYGPLLGATQAAGTLPYAGISNLGAIGGLVGGYGTTSSQQPGGWGNQLLGAAGAALPFIFSDRRLKKDIVEVGTHRSGLTEYEWTYRFDPEAKRYRGVMADEVKEKRPEAYIENWNGTGYAAVNYGAL